MNNMIVFNEESQAIQHLKQADDRLAYLIDRIGNYSCTLRSNYFEALVNSIVGQQLSAMVARVIRGRLLNLCNTIEPSTILNCSDDALREIGISRTKIAYIKNLSSSVLNKQLDFQNIARLPDREVIAELTKLKGIGCWTAEMFMIFSLGRLNVLSSNDIGLQRAMKWLYKLEDYPSPLVMKEYGEVWNPYCTVASLYLWEVINQNLIAE